jgi:Flp pilus assembly protein TadG
MRPRSSYARDEQGSAAVEFALLVPVTLLLLLGIFHLCFVTYAAGSLHWAVEQAARCASVGQRNTGLSCGTSISSVQTYARSIYQGPLVSPTFTASEVTSATTGYCRQVTGSGTYRIILGFVNVDVPVNATACFPEANTGTPWT